MMRLFGVCVLVLVATAGVVGAEPLGTTRVAVIDTSRLWVRGGIAKWIAARAALDAERSRFKPAEAPPGVRRSNKVSDLEIPDGLDPEAKARLRKKLAELDDEAAKKEVWRAHEAEVLDPIVADVHAKLAQFATAHGIGLILDRARADEGLLVSLPGTDVTDAFLKDYNAGGAEPGRSRGK